MIKKYDQMSMVEIAYDLLKENNTKENIRTLIEKVLTIKGITDVDGEYSTQLYMDITTSSKFVFLGEESWDLKERQSLAEWDKDGSAYNVKEEALIEVDDELDEEEVFDDDEIDDELDDDDDEIDDELDDDDDEEKEIELEEEEAVPGFSDLETDDTGKVLERFTEDQDFDEEKYNDLMDDFEDMYD